MRNNTSVHHWRFEDGITCPNPNTHWKSDPLPRGWYCWVYPQDDYEFDNWMTKYCPTADNTHRFNSGDPMHTVFISDDKEAMLFMLRWEM